MIRNILKHDDLNFLIVTNMNVEVKLCNSFSENNFDSS